MKSPKIPLVTILLALSALQTGCTDREIATGAAAAVVTAIIVDSAHRSNPPPPPPRGRRCVIREVEHCDWYRAYGGKVYRCDYRREDSCAPGRYRMMGDNAEALNVAALSSDYGLQPDSSSLLIVALTNAEKAQTDLDAQTAWSSIGVNMQEAREMAASGNIPNGMIDRVAQALDQDPSLTAEMLGRILPLAKKLHHEKNGTSDLNQN